MYYGAYKVGAFSAGRKAARKEKGEGGAGSLLKRLLGGKKTKKPPKGTSRYRIWTGREWTVANLTPKQASAYAARIRAMETARARLVEPARARPAGAQAVRGPMVGARFRAARDRRVRAIASGEANPATGLRAITRTRPERRVRKAEPHRRRAA